VPDDVFMTFSTPPPDLGADGFGRWYQGHLADILRVDGFTAARRFTFDAIVGDTAPTMYAHLALYVIDGDTHEAMARLDAAVADGTVPLPDWFSDVRLASMHGRGLEGPIDLARLDHAYMVFSRPPAQIANDDYVEWYWGHARENLTADGFDAAWRYLLDNERIDPLAPCDALHAAIYEVHGELPQLRAALREAADAGRVGFPEWFGEIQFASLHAHAAGPPVTAG
jgi:hypothetical protein